MSADRAQSGIHNGALCPVSVAPGQTGAAAFDASVGTVGRLGPPPNPTMYIWLGGTVTPPAAAKPGIHTGTVVLSLVYT